MDQPIIHFAHANGFPAKVYSKLFRQLDENYTVIFKNLYGHDSRFPIDANWMNIGKEMIEKAETINFFWLYNLHSIEKLQN